MHHFFFLLTKHHMHHVMLTVYIHDGTELLAVASVSESQ